MKTQIFSDLLGSISLVNYIVGYIFVIIAISIKWLIKTIDSVKNNPNTPEKFDFKFWWKHNGKAKLLTIILVILVVYVTFRLSSELHNTIFSYAFALGVGFGIEKYIDDIRKQLPETK